MEYALGSNPPPYSGMGAPEGGDLKKLTAEDLKPGDDGSLGLIDKSIQEMKDCKSVFEASLKELKSKRANYPLASRLP